ncbi:hypothetical protein EDD27_2160 [Nonomuraea polychroma]|uniref:DinB family protein n=1 Tax=Nonomuraea polychroma TaxID=46176 RepID=A0A438M2G7_9ACTN|nr:hypothetical protein [Nonomuraea polychroma]RVX39787.1 hypothetical protein EDD27_2160 [Nonomuraea polychroma]
MDATALREAHANLLNVAEKCADQQRMAPPPGEWPAEFVLAHVAKNDALLADATELLIAGRALTFDNAEAIDEDVLLGIAAESGGWANLCALVKANGERLAQLTECLTPEQAATLVPSKIVDNGEVRLDSPVPWAQVLQINATFHVLAHTRQLEELFSPLGGMNATGG